MPMCAEAVISHLMLAACRVTSLEHGGDGAPQLVQSLRYISTRESEEYVMSLVAMQMPAYSSHYGSWQVA